MSWSTENEFAVGAWKEILAAKRKLFMKGVLTGGVVVLAGYGLVACKQEAATTPTPRDTGLHTGVDDKEHKGFGGMYTVECNDGKRMQLSKKYKTACDGHKGVKTWE